MLVLTRKCGQKLIINDNIEVYVLETRGDTVKIGIKAPKNISIFREEIYEEIKKANLQSGKDIQLSDIDNALNLINNKKSEKDPYYDKLKNIINVSGNKSN